MAGEPKVPEVPQSREARLGARLVPSERDLGARVTDVRRVVVGPGDPRREDLDRLNLLAQRAVARRGQDALDVRIAEAAHAAARAALAGAPGSAPDGLDHRVGDAVVEAVLATLREE